MTDVFLEVQKDLEARATAGFETYGKPLDAIKDDRDWLTEAYNECLDQAIYLKAEITRRSLR